MKKDFSPKTYNVKIILLFILIQSLKCFDKKILKKQLETDTTRISYMNELIEIIKNYTLFSIPKAHYNVTNECKNLLIKYFSESDNLYIYKMIKDSSHSITKIGSYYNCKNSIYYSPKNSSKSTENLNLTYILFYIPEFQSERSYLFGGCFPSGCNKTDYFYFLKSFNDFSGIINSDDLERIEVYETDSKISFNESFIIGICALIILICIFIFNIFNEIPIILFKRFFALIRCNYDLSTLEDLKNTFNLSENIVELMPVEDKNIHSKNINNDNGIPFIKGFRGIVILLYILGNTMKSLYLFPVKENENKHFNTFSFSMLFFIVRASRNILISISAFLLCYKIMCYFDKEIEKIDAEEEDYIDSFEPIDTIKVKNPNNENLYYEKMDQDMYDERFIRDLKPNNKKFGNFSYIENDLTENFFSDSSKNIGDGLESIVLLNNLASNIRLYKKLPFSSFIRFFLRHLYKYFLFIEFLLIMRYGYYNIVSYLFNKGPLWNFLKQSFIDKESIFHLLGSLFFFYPFIPSLNDLSYNTNDIIILEFSFFIFGSFIIFLAFKKNYRLDKFIIFSLIAQIIIKLSIFFYIWFIVIGDKKYEDSDKFYPSKDFITKEWSFIRNNQFYNFGCYSIGIFFGLVNYIIQKSIKEDKIKYKSYLKIPFLYVKFLQRFPTLNMVVFFFVFFISFLLFGFSYMFLFNLLKGEDSFGYKFYRNIFVNIFYLFDVDTFIIFIFMSLTPYILDGDNVLISILKNEYWNILNRPYFIFILIMPGIITNLLYQTETKYNFQIFSVFFYWSNNLIFGMGICALFYVLFEVPLKKLNIIITKKKKRRRKKEED